MTEPYAENDCPHRPGRGHEWYRRGSDGAAFCRDCGYGAWVCTDPCDHAAGAYYCEQIDGSQP